MAEEQHYLTRFYLEGFTIPDGRNKGACWVYDSNNGVHRTGPRAIAKRADYYTINSHANPRAMEEFFGKVERNTAPVIRALRTSHVLPQGDDRSWLIVFIGIHYLRVPHMRDTLNDFVSRVSNSILACAAAQPNGLEAMLVAAGQATESDAAKVAASIKGGFGGYDFQLADNADAAMLLQVLPTVIRVLDDMKMHLAVAQPGSRFITGDRPATTYAPRHGGWQAGLATKGVEVAFPVDSRCCIIFTWGGPGGTMELGGDLVNQVNYRTTTCSRHLLVGENEAQIRDLVARGSREPDVPQSAPPAA